MEGLSSPVRICRVLILGYVVEDCHGSAGFDQGEILDEPVELIIGYVADIAFSVPEHVVQHDVMDLTSVEGIVVGTEMAAEGAHRTVVGRSEIQVVVADDLEEGHAHVAHAPLVLGVQGQVVEHDVSATHAEKPAAGQRGGGLLHVRDRLRVEEVHFVGILGLGVGEDQESVAIIRSVQGSEIEARGHLTRVVRHDRLVERGRAAWILPNGVSVRRGDRYEGLERVGHDFETAFRVRGGDGQPVRDRHTRLTRLTGQDTAGDAYRTDLRGQAARRLRCRSRTVARRDPPARERGRPSPRSRKPPA